MKRAANSNDDAIINMNPENGMFEVYLQKTVVDEVEDKGKEISCWMPGRSILTPPWAKR